MFVRDGPAWWALLFPVIWLIFHRLWLVLVLYLSAIFAMTAIFSAAEASEIVEGLATALISVLLVLEGNSLRRWKLARSGYRIIDVTSGRDMEECEQRFFDAWLPQQNVRQPAEADMPPRRKESSSEPAQSFGQGDEVIGLFPEPGR